MRLCFALPSKDVIRSGVATLARVCYEQGRKCPSKAPTSAAALEAAPQRVASWVGFILSQGQPLGHQLSVVGGETIGLSTRELFC